MGEVLSLGTLDDLGEEVVPSLAPKATGNPLETSSAGHVKEVLALFDSGPSLDTETSEEVFFRLQESFPDEPTSPTELLNVPGHKPEFRQPPLEELLENAIRHPCVDEPAKAVGLVQIQLFGHHFDSVEDLPGDFDPVETTRIYLLTRMLNNQSEVVRGLRYRSGFQKKLNVSKSTSQSTVSRIVNSDDLGEFGTEIEQALSQLALDFEGTEYEEWLPEPPELEPDGEGNPSEIELLRDLRLRTYPYLRLGRDDSTTHSKDLIFKLLARAAGRNVTLSQAARNYYHKNWIDDEADVPSRQNFDHHLRKLGFEDGKYGDWNPHRAVREIQKMFLAANKELYDLIEPYGYFDGKNEIAGDITDWRFYGDPETDLASGTKPARNTAYAWQFLTMSVVGTLSPLSLMNQLLESRSNKGRYIRHLLNVIDTYLDIDRGYFDSGFYQTSPVRALDEAGLEFVIRVDNGPDKIEDLIAEAKANNWAWNAMDWGVGDVEDGKHLIFVVPSEKRRSRTKPDDDGDKADPWIAFYTNVGWVAGEPATRRYDGNIEQVQLDRHDHQRTQTTPSGGKESGTKQAKTGIPHRKNGDQASNARDVGPSTDSASNKQVRIERDYPPEDPTVLAEGYRSRWGVESGYDSIKNRFLPQSSSTEFFKRVYYFNYAVLHYNMWTAANVKHAAETEHNLQENGKAFTADDITSALSEDPVELDIGEADDLSEFEDVVQGLDPLGGFGDWEE